MELLKKIKGKKDDFEHMIRVVSCGGLFKPFLQISDFIKIQEVGSSSEHMASVMSVIAQFHNFEIEGGGEVCVMIDPKVFVSRLHAFHADDEDVTLEIYDKGIIKINGKKMASNKVTEDSSLHMPYEIEFAYGMPPDEEPSRTNNYTKDSVIFYYYSLIENGIEEDDYGNKPHYPRTRISIDAKELKFIGKIMQSVDGVDYTQLFFDEQSRGIVGNSNGREWFDIHPGEIKAEVCGPPTDILFSIGPDIFNVLDGKVDLFVDGRNHIYIHYNGEDWFAHYMIAQREEDE